MQHRPHHHHGQLTDRVREHLWMHGSHKVHRHHSIVLRNFKKYHHHHLMPFIRCQIRMARSARRRNHQPVSGSFRNNIEIIAYLVFHYCFGSEFPVVVLSILIIDLIPCYQFNCVYYPHHSHVVLTSESNDPTTGDD